MAVTARDVMQTDVHTVSPEMRLPELERSFLDLHVSGFPVVEGDRLVGIVSRSDVVRQLCAERSAAEILSDYYTQGFDAPPQADQSLADIGRRIGVRVESMRVRDVMIESLVTIRPGDPVEQIARTLVERRIHRLPVVEDDRLVGVITSLDLVRLLYESKASGD